jgi:hypothetical protein
MRQHLHRKNILLLKDSPCIKQTTKKKKQRITQVMPLCRKTGKARYHLVGPSSEFSMKKMENYFIDYSFTWPQGTKCKTKT